jgi:hypothetical protein
MKKIKMEKRNVVAKQREEIMEGQKKLRKKKTKEK